VTRILIIEDEPPLARALATNLRVRGYDVDAAGSGEAGLRLAADRPPDLVLLDLGLPGIDGIEVLHGLRGWSSVPVIVLSARGAQHDKIEALDSGADDYVAKPFAMGELLARIRAALRRATLGDEVALVETDDFVIDVAARKARRDDAEVHLTPTEWRIVELLVRHPGKLVSQRMLLQEVWGPSYEDETHYLRVYLAQIRRKLEPMPGAPRYFVTEAGMGYRFEP